jgi:tetratricopeptide (TPR) repeat protein
VPELVFLAVCGILGLERALTEKPQWRGVVRAAFVRLDRLPDAIAQYEAVLRLDPDSAETHFNLGKALLKIPGRLPGAMSQIKTALRLKPDLESAREMLNRLQNPSGLNGAGLKDSSLRQK